MGCQAFLLHCIESGCVYLDVHRAVHGGGHWPAAAADVLLMLIIKTVLK